MSNPYKVKINKDLCTGCGECTENCPVSILKLKEKKQGQFKAECINQNECINCQTCVAVCPQGAIEIIYDENDSNSN